MKQNYISYGLVVVFLILSLIASQTASARILKITQGSGEVVNFKNLNNEGSESYEELMGLEECENGDEDCLKRRAITEVQLDYIYTQNYKP